MTRPNGYQRPNATTAGNHPGPSAHSRPTITVVIPTLNEAGGLATALASAQAPGVETIVVDGGSSDTTVEVAARHGARVMVTSAGRGRQLAAGAAAAQGEHLLFLHGDARLPAGFVDDVHDTLADPDTALGAFRLRIDDASLGLRVVEWGARQRCRWLSLPYGDQALFLRAETYRAVGGYRPLNALEDLEFVRRARRHGRIRTLDAAVLVSARAWHRHGVVGLTLRHAAIVAAYFGGMTPEAIARRLTLRRPVS